MRDDPLGKQPTGDDPSGVPREGPPEAPNKPDSDDGKTSDADGSGTHGDPWITTFDGSGFFFNAYGEFVLARSTDGEFEIQTRQLPVYWYTGNPHPSITSNYAAAMRVGDDAVEIQWVSPSVALILVNGNEIDIEVGESIAVGDGSIYRSSSTSYIASNGLGDGMQVTVGGIYLNIYPFVDPSRAGEMQGVQGNYDGDRSNDFALPDETVLPSNISFQELYTTFADAWRVTDDTSLFTYLVDRSTEDFTDLGFPPGVVRLEDFDPDVVAAAETAAIDAGLIPGTWLFETTVFDMALTGDFEVADTAAAAPDFVFVEEDGSPADIQTVEVDLPPSVGTPTGPVTEDGSVLLDVLPAAVDPEGGPVTLLEGADPNGGTVSVQDGQLLFAPAPDFFGEARVAFTVGDIAGNRTIGTVTVDVAPIDDAPRPADDFGAGFSTDKASAFTTASVLTNDLEVDGDTLEIVGFDASGARGLVTDNGDGTFDYDPNGAFDGLVDADFIRDRFTYQVSDGTTTLSAEVRVFVTGAPGITVIEGTPLVDMLPGSEGSDLVFARGSSDVVNSFAGNDRIEAGSGFDVIDAGDGDDTVIGAEGFDTIRGGTGADTLNGNAGNDTLEGGDGEDTLNGGVGADTLAGGEGDDELKGAAGEDTLSGDQGDDDLFGNAGNDTLFGGEGNDTLNGGIGFDDLFGGSGDDTISGLDGFDDLFGGDGMDFIAGNAGNDTIEGGAGNDTLEGGQGADVIRGDDGDDMLRGQTGGDDISGGRGNDMLFGGEGADRISGGAGNDMLTGGSGADTFVFDAGVDTITDLSLIVDAILLDGAALGIVGLSGMQVVDTFGEIVSGDTVLTFSLTNVLTLTGITNSAAVLGESIEVI